MKLNKDQERAAMHFGGPMLVLAGPGSGKTAVLTERIRRLIHTHHIDSERVLVITFSKKAALSMQHRFLESEGDAYCKVTFGTFHAVFFHIIKSFNRFNSNSILTNHEKREYIREAGTALKVENAVYLSWQNSMLEKISYYKNCKEALFEKESGFVFDEEEKRQFDMVMEKYSKLCAVHGKIDFDDMVCECLKLLKQYPQELKKWQERYEYVMVDEFQDINEPQYEVLKLLVANHHNLFCVGDDDQSIYGFRGAKPDIMQRFLCDYPESDMVYLATNYRFGKAIIDAADSLIVNNKQRLERQKQLPYDENCIGEVIKNSFDNEYCEADYIIEELQKYFLSDVAIIYRSGHCVGTLTEKLKMAGIPYTTNEKTVDIYDTEEALIIISYLKIAIGMADATDYYRVMNIPKRGISQEAYYACCKGGDVYDFFERLAEYMRFDDEAYKKICRWKNDMSFIADLPPKVATNYLIKANGLHNMRAGTSFHKYEATDFYDELCERMDAFTTIEGFIKYIKEYKASDESEAEMPKSKRADGNEDAENKEAVTLITAHASKGLEYPVVFVIGLQEGLFPHHKNLCNPNLEEERRLLYVSMTRAKKVLYLCGRGQTHGKRVSRFFEEVKLSKTQ